MAIPKVSENVRDQGLRILRNTAIAGAAGSVHLYAAVTKDTRNADIRTFCGTVHQQQGNPNETTPPRLP